MNPRETTRLMRTIVAYLPAMRLSDETVAVWHLQMRDIAFPLAEQAVHEYFSSCTDYPGPADIRRRVANTLGLLPDEASAWDMALRVALDEGQGRRLLPPAVRAAYDHAGGAPTIRNGLPAAVRKAFLEAYRAAGTRCLAEDLARQADALETVQRLALGASESEITA